MAAGATGRSSGFVRMHYDLESESALAWLSFPYFRSWAELVGVGRPGLRADRVPARDAGGARRRRCAPTSPIEQGLGIPIQAVEPAEIARLVPGAVTDGLAVGAYEPESGYADPSGTAAGFLAAARRLGTRLVQGSRVRSIAVEGDAVSGVDTDRGRIAAPVVAVAVGRLGRGPRPDRGRRAARPGVAPRDGVLRPARRPRTGLPDRHRRGQRGLLPARGRRPDAGRAGGPQRGGRLAGPAARRRPRRPPSRTWSGGSARASPG